MNTLQSFAYDYDDQYGWFECEILHGLTRDVYEPCESVFLVLFIKTTKV